MSAILDQAIHYGKLGYKVFPCYQPVFRPNGVFCSCNDPKCRYIGKHPAVRDQYVAASSDEQEIRRMWQRDPEFNIGLPTGAINGFDVIDVDPRHMGDVSLAKWEEEHGSFEPTMKTLTGSKGFHFFFLHTPGLRNNNDGKIAQGIDLRTNKGYVIAPPSLHFSGNRYEWLITTPLSEPPDWLVHLLQTLFSDGHTNKAQTQNKKAKKTKEDWDALAEKIPDGQRHAAITSVAGLLFHEKTNIPSYRLALRLLCCYAQFATDNPREDKELKKEVYNIVKYVLKRKN